MHLQDLAIRNFRSFDDEMIALSPSTTVFVGENNGGKSNAIDAIRLLTTPSSERREIYCEPTDIRFGAIQRRFDIEATFSDLSAAQQGRFISTVRDETLETAVFGLTYQERGMVGSLDLWGGQFRSQPEPGCREMIRHVYLPPLRDAKRALASGNPTRIHALLKHFLGEDDPDELAKRLQRPVSEPILTKVDGAVDAGLERLTSGVRRQASSLGFAQSEQLIDIARDLRFKLADHGIEPEDLRYSGLGYANLLYMAIIAVELEKVHSADLTLFLVEEPEAHLHPQLQAAVLSYLEEQAEQSKSRQRADHGPAGELQVIVATHSPNLSAWVQSKNLVVFKSENSLATSSSAKENNKAKAADALASMSSPRRISRCIPLATLSLSSESRRKIDRYLDVTKSAFLFGGRVLLIEGIAEALLLPVMAKKFVFKNDPERLRVFRSSVFVPIDGVDFVPYVRLLLTPVGRVRIADRLVVVTDGDRTKSSGSASSPGQQRKVELERIAAELGASEVLGVITNTYSLESELVRAGNAELMKQAYLQCHPRSEEKWDSALAITDEDDQAAAVQALFESTRKGDFAQILSERMLNATNFAVPLYLSDAIEAVVK